MNASTKGEGDTHPLPIAGLTPETEGTDTVEADQEGDQGTIEIEEGDLTVHPVDPANPTLEVETADLVDPVDPAGLEAEGEVEAAEVEAVLAAEAVEASDQSLHYDL